MDQELKAYLDDLKTSIVKQATGLEDLKASMEERFAQQDEKIETTARQTQVLVEALASRVDLVFEGVDAANEKLAAFQKDTACRFEEGQASIAPYYRELNGRLLRVEEAVRVKKSRKRQTS